jgi:hypothetical protein
MVKVLKKNRGEMMQVLSEAEVAARLEALLRQMSLEE